MRYRNKFGMTLKKYFMIQNGHTLFFMVLNQLNNNLWFLRKKPTFTNNDTSDYKRGKNLCSNKI